MKYAVCIPTYHRPKLLGIAVESLQKDPTNPGFSIFVSSDSSPEYRTKEIENLKVLCNRGPSKIYYIDTERSEPYKKELQKHSCFSKEIIDIAMNGGSAGANRNRLLLLACTYGAERVIFLDDDMNVEPGFIKYHGMGLGNTVSQFLKKFEEAKNIKSDISRLKQKDLEKNIEVFGPNWEWEYRRKFFPNYDFYHCLGKGATLDAGNLSVTSLVYSKIPFTTLQYDEDWIFGLCAFAIVEIMNGIIIMTDHVTSYQRELLPTSSEREKKMNELASDIRSKCGDITFGELKVIWDNVTKILPTSLGRNYGRKLVERIGKEIQNLYQSPKLQEMFLNFEKELENLIKEYNFENSFDAKTIAKKLKKQLYGTGVLYQNWTELTDAAKKIDSSILEEFLVTE